MAWCIAVSALRTVRSSKDIGWNWNVVPDACLPAGGRHFCEGRKTMRLTQRAHGTGMSFRMFVLGPYPPPRKRIVRLMQTLDGTGTLFRVLVLQLEGRHPPQPKHQRPRQKLVDLLRNDNNPLGK
ncbi:hypothetical protein DL98DRAFT_303499 [Cadophora sp. DSE1049]|nr:hypothetical protein DL98DRAFT_303499 [Cadophora sp. DSE1049]